MALRGHRIKEHKEIKFKKTLSIYRVGSCRQKSNF